MSIDVKVTGAREVEAALRRIEQAAARPGMAGELDSEWRSVADAVEATARSEAPRRSGRLQAAIKAVGTATGSAVVVAIVYGPAIHWGWPGRPDPQRGWRGGPIPPNPFLQRAVERQTRPARETLAAGVQRFFGRVI